MAASTGDKITDTRNAARPVSTTVSVNRAAAGSSLSCASLTGWPTASKVHFVTYKIDTNSDPVAGSQLDCYGIVSGSAITSFTVVDGTDSGHAVGDVVEMLPTSAWGQDLSDALTVAHNRDGSLQTVGVSKGGTGAATLAAHGVVVGNGTSAVNVTTTGTSGQVLTSGGASADPTWQTNAATGYFSLLYANSGTDTNTSAANVDTIALSGLTAKDSIHVKFNVYAITQAANAGNTGLVSSTDGNTQIITPVTTTVTASSGAFGEATVRQSQAANTTLQALGWGCQDAGSLEGRSRSPAMSTAWTGSWTLALRYPGMVSGGTLEWSWAVYKIAGQ